MSASNPAMLIAFSTSCNSYIVCISVQEQQYSKWMAACRLASKGKTLADSSFSSEVQNIQSFLAMQRTKPGNKTAPSDESINTHSLVSPRYQKKYKPKQVALIGLFFIGYLSPFQLFFFLLPFFTSYLFFSRPCFSLLADSSYSGGLSERGTALINGCCPEVSADLASFAWLWALLFCSQVGQVENLIRVKTRGWSQFDSLVPSPFFFFFFSSAGLKGAVKMSCWVSPITAWSASTSA